MFRKISLESLMKWIFLLIALSMVVLVIGARLRQSYITKRISAVETAERFQRSADTRRLRISGGNVPVDLGPYWRLSRAEERPSFVVGQTGFERGYSLDRGAIFIDMVEEERFLILVGMLGLIIAVELAVFLSYLMTRPLRRLTWMCREVAAGSIVRVPQAAFSPSEFYELIESFNNMSSQLQRWREVQRQVSRMDRLAALGEMVSGLSHEIRNPLASMMIQTDLLRDEIDRLAARSEDCPEAEEAREQIAVLGSEIDRLNNIIMQLLSFVRSRPTLITPVSLDEILPWSLAMLGSQAHKQGVLLELNSDDANLIVMADGEELRQLVMNLSINAMQAMAGQPRKKELAVSIGRGKSPGGRTSGVITVSDSGPGIPEEIEHRIFDPFFTTKKDGTGLGLCIVQRIIEGLDGELTLDSGPNGTTFRIFLKLQEAEAAHEHLDS